MNTPEESVEDERVEQAPVEPPAELSPPDQSEGEKAVVEIADSIENGFINKDIYNLWFYNRVNGEIKKNLNSELHSSGAKAAKHINNGMGGTVLIASVNICNTPSIHPP